MKRKRIPILFILILVSVLIVAVIYTVRDVAAKPIFSQSDNDKQALQTLDDISDSSFNALLIGLDKSAVNTDAIMLVNVDKSEKCIRMLSIPRDTKVTVDGKTRKINSCYYRYGLDVLISEIKELTCSPINYYAIIKPGVLAEIVDCLGGVEYDVEQNMHYSDPAQDLYINLEKGTQTLTGDQAEQYCRYRSYLLGDITRTQSQQKFFKALFEQKLNLKNITKINALLSVVGENVETNVDFLDIINNLSVMQMIKNGDQIECIETPGTYNDMQKEGVSYYLIRNDNLHKLREICSEKFLGTYTE